MKARVPGGGGPSMNQMLKQAQKMQEDMAALQEELNAREYTANAGGGAVTATVNGSHEVTDLKIRPDVVDPDDVEMLEDMVLAALNDAMKQADDLSKELLGPMGNAGGLF